MEKKKKNPSKTQGFVQPKSFWAASVVMMQEEEQQAELHS